MRASSISPRRFRRQLTVTLAMIGLVSAAILMPGVVGAALKSSHPAIPATGEVLESYSAIGSNIMTYHNGPVILNPDVKLIFEGSSWTAAQMQTVKQYFIDVSGTAFEGILTQYYDTDANGTKYYISNTITVSASVQDANFMHSAQCVTNGPGIMDTGLATSPLGSPNDIYDEIQNEATANNWSMTSSIFFVFPPSGSTVFDGNCSTTPCGYHSSFTTDSGITNTIYAVIPYGGGPCNSSFPTGTDPVQIDINTASHEQFEAIANPTWTVFQQSGGGWYNNDNCNQNGSACEIGDDCANEHLGVYLNGHTYPEVQGEFSNTPGTNGHCEYTTAPPPTPTPTNTPVPTCSVTNETDNIQPSNGTNPYVDNRGNTWYVYYDIKRDAKTNAPCQMQLVVRIFNPAPNGAWSGTASLYTLVNGNYDSASFGKVSGSCTYQYHFVWRGPWFKAGSAYYHLETFEYNGSNAYTRAWANFSI